jgi:hypothetical protein
MTTNDAPTARTSPDTEPTNSPAQAFAAIATAQGIDLANSATPSTPGDIKPPNRQTVSVLAGRGEDTSDVLFGEELGR